METFPKKKRGRPRKIPESLVESLGVEVPKAPEVRELFGESMRTGRTRANRFYADGAREVIEAYAKQLKEHRVSTGDPVHHAKVRLGMDWILRRKTVLTELGRMMDQDEGPTEQEIKRLQDVVWHISARHDRLTAKAACAYVRGRRMGETKRRDRVASLHHDLNAAINLHRQRYPESTWDDVRKALEHTVSQVSRKA
jgi:hypothetical protein